MPCLPNCGKCCSCIPIPKETFEKYKDKIQSKVIKLNDLHGENVFPITEDMFCVFLNRKSKMCEIYENRPALCWGYGPPECLKWKDYIK